MNQIYKSNISESELSQGESPEHSGMNLISSSTQNAKDVYSLLYNNPSPKTQTLRTRYIPNHLTRNQKLPVTNSILQFGHGLACVCVLVPNSASFPDYNHAKCKKLDSFELIQPTIIKSKTKKENEIDNQVEMIDQNNDGNITWEIQIWYRGSIDTELMTKHLIQCVNQTILEYHMEGLYISPQEAFKEGSNIVENIEEENQVYDEESNEKNDDVPNGDDISDYIDLLERLNELNAPSLKYYSTTLNIPGWSLNSWISSLQTFLIESMRDNPHTFYSYQLDSDEMLGKCVPFTIHSKAAGLGTLARSINFMPPQLVLSKDKLQFVVKSNINIKKFSKTKDLTFYKDIQTDVGTIHRFPFCLILLSTVSLKVWTYNWAVALSDRLIAQINNLEQWTGVRKHFMDDILHQKMGLFTHIPELLPERLSVLELIQPEDTRDSKGQNSKSNSSAYNFKSISLIANNTTVQQAIRSASVNRNTILGSNIGGASLNISTILQYTYPLSPSSKNRSISLIQTDPVKWHGQKFQEVKSICKLFFN